MTPAQQQLVIDNRNLGYEVVNRYRHLTDHRVTVGDLEQAAMEGLCEAALSYEPDRDTAFGTFAWIYIRAAVFREVASNRYAVYFPQKVAQALHMRRHVSAELTREHGREPTDDEVIEAMADKAYVSPETMQRAVWSSMEAPLAKTAAPNGEGHAATGRRAWGAVPASLRHTPQHAERITQSQRHQRLDCALRALPRRQEAIVRAYYGVGVGRQETVEICDELGLSSSSVNNIRHEAEATLADLLG